MDRIISFLLIIIIVCASYDYCSTEGLNHDKGGREGDHTSSDDALVKEKGCPYPNVTSISDSVEATDKCQYKGLSCLTAMEHGSVKKNWVYGYSHPWPIAKLNCMKCVQGSEQDSTTRKYMAGLGYEVNKTRGHLSNFALHLCDGMAAGCDDSIFYANNRSDWGQHDCKGVGAASTHSKSTKALCLMLSNSFLQFFLGLFGGTVCTLKIKALELKQVLKKTMTKVECEICKGTPGCDEKKHCN